MKTSLQIIATLVAKPGSETELRALLPSAVQEFRIEPGCMAYVLLEDKKHPGRFMTYETWNDEAALAKHMKSPAMAKLMPKMSELLAGDVKQDFLTILLEI